MDTIIIYGSCYGTTKIYAEALAERMGLHAVPYDRAGNLGGYQKIIYLGGLYAGSVKGLAKTVRKIDPTACRRFAVITVELADPEDEEYVRNIRTSAGRQIPETLREKSEFYHLRGGIDYARLNFMHRTMMKLLYDQVKRHRLRAAEFHAPDLDETALRSGEKEAAGRSGRRNKSYNRDLWEESGFCGSGTAG